MHIQQAGRPTATLESVVNNLAQKANWSIKNFMAGDNGEQVAKSMLEGTAIAVCDG
jgi:hypothetical protein